MEGSSHLPAELTPASDTSNTVSIISKLYLKPLVSAVRVRVLFKEKLNDRPLLVLDPAAKNLSAQRR
jgi:hypothetical protein